VARPSRYSSEVRERAVRMVQEHGAEHPSQWRAIQSVAEKLGCRDETLRRRVRQAERDAGERPGLTTTERNGSRSSRVSGGVPNGNRRCVHHSADALDALETRRLSEPFAGEPVHPLTRTHVSPTPRSVAPADAKRSQGAPSQESSPAWLRKTRTPRSSRRPQGFPVRVILRALFGGVHPFHGRVVTLPLGSVTVPFPEMW